MVKTVSVGNIVKSRQLRQILTFPFLELGKFMNFLPENRFSNECFKAFLSSYFGRHRTVVSMLNPALHVPKFPNWNLGNLCILRTFSTLIWISPLTKCGQQRNFCPLFHELEKIFLYSYYICLGNDSYIKYSKLVASESLWKLPQIF